MEIEYKVKLYYRVERRGDVLLKLPTLADPIEVEIIINKIEQRQDIASTLFCNED
jgi:hypothetical protein